MNVKKILYVCVFLVFLTVCGIVSINSGKPSFELIKGNNPPVEYNEELLKININTATEKELAGLEGIGSKMAERIILYRNEIGGFTNLSQLLDVTGIGEKKLDAIMDSVTLK